MSLFPFTHLPSSLIRLVRGFLNDLINSIVMTTNHDVEVTLSIPDELAGEAITEEEPGQICVKYCLMTLPNLREEIWVKTKKSWLAFRRQFVAVFPSVENIFFQLYFIKSVSISVSLYIPFS